MKNYNVRREQYFENNSNSSMIIGKDLLQQGCLPAQVSSVIYDFYSFTNCKCSAS